jgi:CheY-like chemotaxis protein
MPSLEEPTRVGGTIMVVDDNPANLKMLEDALRQMSYRVRCFPSGRLALTAAAENPPDLILLDVNMPEMSGYEVCERLKAAPLLADIPVLFISALHETGDKVKGFRSGGVDYISKPFQFEEVYARIETHLKLKRAQQAERELLELTLNGAIRMLAGLVHAASPELTARSRAIRDCVTWIGQRVAVRELWQYDLAATLCLIGCITLPEEAFKRGYAGDHASPDEEMMLRSHPETGARLLANIPRLEPTAEMIRLQQVPDSNPDAPEQVRMGARMLHLAVELDRRIYRGLPFRAALQELKSTPGRFDAEMIATLAHYSPASAELHRETLLLKQLFAGMTMDEDVIGENTGTVIFRKDTVLNETWIERLKNFARSQGIKEPLRVCVPGPAAAPVFKGFK